MEQSDDTAVTTKAAGGHQGEASTMLPLVRRYWPPEALHMWRERLALHGGDGPEAEAWAEEETRAAWAAPLPAAWVWPGDGSWEAWVVHVRAMPTVEA